MIKSVSMKMGLHQGDRAILINAPADAVQAIDPSGLQLETELIGDFDYIHLFVVSQLELHKQLPAVKNQLKPTGTIWVSWPKDGQKGTDLALPTVIKIAYDYGFVESKCLRVNNIWSALKLTWPKAGKVYNNKYGKLNQ